MSSLSPYSSATGVNTSFPSLISATEIWFLVSKLMFSLSGTAVPSMLSSPFTGGAVIVTLDSVSPVSASVKPKSAAWKV